MTGSSYCPGPEQVVEVTVAGVVVVMDVIVGEDCYCEDIEWFDGRSNIDCYQKRIFIQLVISVGHGSWSCKQGKFSRHTATSFRISMPVPSNCVQLYPTRAVMKSSTDFATFTRDRRKHRCLIKP